VESTIGVGSTFSFTINLPAIELGTQPEPAQSNHDADIAPIGSSSQQYAILIVDDHPVNRMLLKQQLELLAIDVVAVDSGAAALKLWQNGHFHIIITDCHMPEMDGYELTRHIREIEEMVGSKRIPIIAWTANVMIEEIEHCHAAGMDGLLTKPTALGVLRAEVLKWLVKSGVMTT